MRVGHDMSGLNTPILRRLQGHAWAIATLAAAVVVAAGAVIDAPERGLTLETWSNPDLAGDPVASRRDLHLYFDSRDAHRHDRHIAPGSSRRWTGYLRIPRTGTYGLRLTTDDGGRLYLDGELVIDNGGEHPARSKDVTRTLRRGDYAIRIEHEQREGDAVMLLEWDLPAGYFARSVVPASHLFVDRPPPHSVGAGLMVGLPVLLLLLALLQLCRAPLGRWVAGLRTSPAGRRTLMAGLLVLTLAGGWRFWDLSGAGETMDEWAYTGAGEIYFGNAIAGNTSAEQWRANRQHPPIGKLLYGWAGAVFGPEQTVQRATAAGLSTLTALLVFLVGLELFGLAAGTLAGALYATLPAVLAHARVAGLEAPLAFFMVLAVYFSVVAVTRPERRQLWFVLAGLATGLAIGSKPTGVLLLPLLFGAFLVTQRREVRASGELRVPLAAYAFPVLAILPTLLLWPWLWEHPLGHLIDTLAHWDRWPKEWFFGVERGELPRWYLLPYFVATTPEWVLAAGALGVALVALPRRLLARCFPDRSTRGAVAFVIAWLLVHFVMSLSQMKQDGVRHIYPVFAPLAILAAAGAVAGLRLATSSVRALQGRPAAVLAAGSAALVAGTMISSARVHPYHLDYFNNLYGSLQRIYEGRIFEVGWWGEGLERAQTYLNEEAPPRSTYWLESPVSHTLNGLRSDLRKRSVGPDYVVRTHIAPGTVELEGYEPVDRVTLSDVPLVVVYRRR